jgi:hypothetical protein
MDMLNKSKTSKLLQLKQIIGNMNTLDDILEHYDNSRECQLSQEEQHQINEEASQHLQEYLCGDGDIRHLHEYYDCLEKI